MKILCIPYTHALSHISRVLLVAQELRDRGHVVVFAGSSPKVTFVREEKFSVIPLYEPDPSILFGNIRKGKLKFISDDDIHRMITADLALYKEVKPDIVLTDGRFTAPLSTYIAGVKHAAIVNVSSTEYRALPYIPFFEWFPAWFMKRNTKFCKLLDLLNLKLEMFVFDNVMSIFKELSKKCGAEKTVTATNCLTGKDITLIADIPDYFPTRNLPANYHYVGPLTWKSSLLTPIWWPPKKNRAPLVYITMGTTGISDFFQKVYDLFKASGISAIISTGGQAKGLENIEGKIYVENYIDGDMALEACDLVVCHGGNGTIYQALQHGKPVIGIPTIPDQKFNMRRVEALGCGKTITWQTFIKTPDSLLKVVNEVTNNPSFSNCAQRLQKIISTYDSSNTAADLIEKMICPGY